MTDVKLGLSGIAQLSAAEAAAEAIRGAIVAGKLRPGQPLRESSLSAELGLSRTPIREAMLLLQADGLVDLNRNRGARVATYTRADLEDAYSLRAVIEAYAAGRAATRATAADIEALRQSCRRFDSLLAGQDPEQQDITSLVAENLTFHTIVQRCSGSRRVAPIIRGLIHLPLLYRAHIWYSPTRKIISERHHHDIADALATRAAETARALMYDHVMEAGNAALIAMDARQAARTDSAEIDA